MTTDQPSLFSDHDRARYLAQLEDLLERALRVVRYMASDEGPADLYDVERALELVRRISIEIRVIQSEDGVPF